MAARAKVDSVFQPCSPEWLMNGTRFHAWRFGAFLFPMPDGSCEWCLCNDDGTNPNKSPSVDAAKAEIMRLYRENEAKELATIEGPTKPAA